MLAVKRFPLLPDIHAGDDQSGDRNRPGWPHCTVSQSSMVAKIFCIAKKNIVSSKVFKLNTDMVLNLTSK